VSPWAWLGLLAPLLTPPVLAHTGRWGILPLLMPRSWRAWYRGLRPRGKQKSARISKQLRDQVMTADRKRCVARSLGDCAGTLQVDHRVPWRLGGIGCLANCFAMCKRHNQVKSAFYVRADGSYYYPRFLSRRRVPAARAIVARERLAAVSPWRWLRAYGLLPSL
jgi:hypothetical protein